MRRRTATVACRNASRAFGPGSRRAATPAAGTAAIAVSAAIALGGCGGSSPGSGAGSSAASAQAAAPPVTGTTNLAALKAQEEAIHRQVLAALHHHSSAKYGGLPSYLPKSAQAPTGRVLHADPAHPVLAIQGDTVTITLPRGTATATVVGPRLPAGVSGTGAKQALATFTVTLSHVTGTVPVDASRFQITDDLGRPHAPALRTVTGGHTVELSLVLPRGAGEVRYLVPGLPKPLVAWDYALETD